MTPCVVRSASCVVCAVILASGCNRSENLPPSIRYADHVNAGGSLPPATDVKNPSGTDSGSVKDGERIFASMNCDGCHGGGATGWVGPSLVDGRWRYGGSDGALFQSIFYGRPRGMPAYGGVLSATAIWKVVTYIRAQPVPSVVPTQRWPGSETEPRPVREDTRP
jgi:mono/diheme cytochrome c family protein